MTPRISTARSLATAASLVLACLLQVACEGGRLARCRGDSDCAGDTTARCVNSLCVQCRGDDDCAAPKICGRDHTCKSLVIGVQVNDQIWHAGCLRDGCLGRHASEASAQPASTRLGRPYD